MSATVPGDRSAQSSYRRRRQNELPLDKDRAQDYSTIAGPRDNRDGGSSRRPLETRNDETEMRVPLPLPEASTIWPSASQSRAWVVNSGDVQVARTGDPLNPEQTKDT